VAVFAEAGDFLIAVLYGLAILLFPDGTLPSRRWRPVLWAYLAASVIFTANGFIEQSTALTMPHLRVDVTGSPVNNPSPVGGLARAADIAGYALIVIAACWACFVARQVLGYLRASGERRQQLKWLVSGSAICVTAIVVTIQAGNYSGPAAQAVLAIGVLGVAALPACIGMAILKYRLYDIDRIISRTLAYAIVTGLLIGLYAGLVLLATQVFRFHSTAAVAAATLAAAALFSPLRRRVQHVVDQRFNRARYDADRTAAAFAARLKDAVDLDSVRDDLAGVVNQTLEPAHISMWISRRD
jgi:NADH:ubiquinone oxidoreductase subunit K